MVRRLLGRASVIVVLGAAAASLAGCGDGGVSPGGEGGSAGAPSAGGGSASTGDGGGAIDLHGEVAILAGVLSHGNANGKDVASTSFTAQFEEGTAFALPAQGRCIVAPSTSFGQSVSAGTITLQGAATPITIPPASGELYRFSDSTKADWSPGDRLTVSASGSADIRPFTLSTVAPGHLDFATAGETFDVDLHAPFAITWEPIATGSLLIGLSGPAAGASDQGASVALECLYDGKAGSARISPTDLALFGAGKGTLGAEAISMTVIDDATWQVAFALLDGTSISQATFH